MAPAGAATGGSGRYHPDRHRHRWRIGLLGRCPVRALRPGLVRVLGSSISNSGTITVGPSITVSTGGTFTQTQAERWTFNSAGAPSSGAFGFVNVSRRGDAGRHTQIGPRLRLHALDDRHLHSRSSSPAIRAPLPIYSLPSSSTYQFAGAVTFTNVVISAAPATAVTSTINANTNVDAVATNLLGINLAYWDDQLTTTQTQQMVTAAGLNLYRFPGGSASDDFHFNVSDNYGDSAANTIPQFAQFISAVGGAGMVTRRLRLGQPAGSRRRTGLSARLDHRHDRDRHRPGMERQHRPMAKRQLADRRLLGQSAGRLAAGHRRRLEFPADRSPRPVHQHQILGNRQRGIWELGNRSSRHGRSRRREHRQPARPGHLRRLRRAIRQLATEITSTAGLPAISIGIDSGDPTGASDNNWTQECSGRRVEPSAFVPSFISDHSYMQGPGDENDSFLLNDTVSDPGSYSGLVDALCRLSSRCSSRRCRSQASSVPVMATEFNSVYTNPGKQSTSLVNGLFIADSIGSLLDSGYQGGFVWDLRNGWANRTRTTATCSTAGAKAATTASWAIPNTTIAPSTGRQHRAIPATTPCNWPPRSIPAGGQVVSATSNYGDLDVYAVHESNGHLDLLVINTNPAASLTDQFNLTGFQPGSSAQVWQYGETQDTAQSLSSNGASALANSTATLSPSGGSFSYTFPAYSMTVLDLTPAPVSDVLAANTTGTSITQSYAAARSP